jgi:hypothetical protein
MKNSFRRTTLIACATVVEDILPFIPPELSYQILDFGLHVKPEELKTSLQQSIDQISPSNQNIIVGYGLCSQAVVGLKSASSTLVIPKVDDCIAIFLGSERAYRYQQKNEPGTYYLTKGFLKTKSTPFDEFDDLIKKYGQEKASRLFGQLIKNYKRLAFIHTGPKDLEPYRLQAGTIADRFGLHFEDLTGSDRLIKKMIFGPWDDDFILVKPGGTVSLADFFENPKQAGL